MYASSRQQPHTLSRQHRRQAADGVHRPWATPPGIRLKKCRQDRISTRVGDKSTQNGRASTQDIRTTSRRCRTPQIEAQPRAKNNNGGMKLRLALTKSKSVRTRTVEGVLGRNWKQAYFTSELRGIQRNLHSCKSIAHGHGRSRQG